jgi:alpha-glucosidase
MPETWWRTGAIYQVYPRSFQDSGGDGVGDIEGLRRRLEYLAWLGVDAIWISPIYPSPMHDFGYDVAEYCDIDPIFGSLAQFDQLVRDAHKNGLKIILDLVPNHTSIDHPWFQASRSSKSDPKRDWYIWRDPKPDGGPPSNWLSHFGGSAWEFDQATGQYYYHAYLAEQPDLNWRNPQVRAAIYDVLRFWLQRGVDGFRVDVMWHLIKHPDFRENPPNPDWTPDRPEIERLLPLYSEDQPEVHEVVAEMRRVIDAFEDRLLIGEIYLPVDRLVAYYGRNLSGAHLPFNFQLLAAPWTAQAIAAIVERYEEALRTTGGGWPNWVLSNHDRPRVAARVGAEQARVAAMLLLTLRGTPTLYYGDELGISSVEIAPHKVQDPWAKREPLANVGRDPSRTPMQWDATANAGFSAHEPWLPLTPDYKTRNVAVMRQDQNSILMLVRDLLHYRRDHAALCSGDWRLLSAQDNVLAYERALSGERFFIALNFSSEPRGWRPPNDSPVAVAISTCGNRRRGAVEGGIELRPNEGLLLRA